MASNFDMNPKLSTLTDQNTNNSCLAQSSLSKNQHFTSTLDRFAEQEQKRKTKLLYLKKDKMKTELNVLKPAENPGGGKKVAKNRVPLEERAQKLMDEKISREEAERKRKAELERQKEVENCTFKPKLNKSKEAKQESASARDVLDYCDKLYRKEEEKQKKIAENVLAQEAAIVQMRGGNKKLGVKEIEKSVDRLYSNHFAMEKKKEKAYHASQENHFKPSINPKSTEIVNGIKARNAQDVSNIPLKHHQTSLHQNGQHSKSPTINSSLLRNYIAKQETPLFATRRRSQTPTARQSRSKTPSKLKESLLAIKNRNGSQERTSDISEGSKEVVRKEHTSSRNEEMKIVEEGEMELSNYNQTLEKMSMIERGVEDEENNIFINNMKKLQVKQKEEERERLKKIEQQHENNIKQRQEEGKKKRKAIEDAANGKPIKKSHHQKSKTLTKGNLSSIEQKENQQVVKDTKANDVNYIEKNKESLRHVKKKEPFKQHQQNQRQEEARSESREKKSRRSLESIGEERSAVLQTHMVLYMDAAHEVGDYESERMVREACSSRRSSPSKVMEWSSPKGRCLGKINQSQGEYVTESVKRNNIDVEDSYEWKLVQTCSSASPRKDAKHEVEVDEYEDDLDQDQEVEEDQAPQGDQDEVPQDDEDEAPQEEYEDQEPDREEAERQNQEPRGKRTYTEAELLEKMKTLCDDDEDPEDEDEH